MIPGDEQDARFEHQAVFLFERGLTSSEMEDWRKQLWLLERLAGKDPSKLDPKLRERLQGELERATMAQLKATGLMDEWLESWDARGEGAFVSLPASGAALPAPRVDVVRR